MDELQRRLTAARARAEGNAPSLSSAGDSPSGRLEQSSSEAASLMQPKAAWQQELKLHDELFAQLAYNLPADMPATKAKLEKRLAA